MRLGRPGRRLLLLGRPRLARGHGERAPAASTSTSWTPPTRATTIGARKRFERLLPWVQHMEAGAYNQKAKLGLRHLGIDCGDVRPPLLPLGDDAAATLIEVLDAVLR